MGIIDKIFFRGNSDKSTITVNGKSYKGNSIKIINDDVYIDGVLKESGSNIAHHITIEGNVNELVVEKGVITVEGDVYNLETTSGDVEIGGDVYGDVGTTSGDIEIGSNVGGNVTTVSGDVDAKKIMGNVKTVSGDVDKSF